MIFKKLMWAIKRHPFLYITRFRLLSKNSSSDEIKTISYNDLNEESKIPSYFKEINKKIFPDNCPKSNFETVKQLAIWLKSNIIGGPGLSEPSEQALKTMLSGNGGVCSDIAQIFNNFCVINNIRVREWGTTSSPFNRNFGGHSFNEVYLNDFKKWVLIDASYNIFFYQTSSDVPLSVTELYKFKRNNCTIIYDKFNNSIEKVNKRIIIKNYLNKTIVPFLICNYNNRTYDLFLKSFGRVFPVFVTHFTIYLLGKSYHYKFPLDDYHKIFT